MSKGGSLKKEAWEVLRKSIMYHHGMPIGTIAATTIDPLEDMVNYNQVNQFYITNNNNTL